MRHPTPGLLRCRPASVGWLARRMTRGAHVRLCPWPRGAETSYPCECLCEQAKKALSRPSNPEVDRARLAVGKRRAGAPPVCEGSRGTGQRRGAGATPPLQSLLKQLPVTKASPPHCKIWARRCLAARRRLCRARRQGPLPPGRQGQLERMRRCGRSRQVSGGFIRASWRVQLIGRRVLQIEQLCPPGCRADQHDKPRPSDLPCLFPRHKQSNMAAPQPVVSPRGRGNPGPCAVAPAPAHTDRLACPPPPAVGAVLRPQGEELNGRGRGAGGVCAAFVLKPASPLRLLHPAEVGRGRGLRPDWQGPHQAQWCAAAGGGG
jgi:hypothetical protein